jgi:hypothetical protein
MFAKNSPNWFWHMVDISELKGVFSFLRKLERQLKNGKIIKKGQSFGFWHIELTSVT